MEYEKEKLISDNSYIIHPARAIAIFFLILAIFETFILVPMLILVKTPVLVKILFITGLIFSFCIAGYAMAYSCHKIVIDFSGIKAVNTITKEFNYQHWRDVARIYRIHNPKGVGIYCLLIMNFQ